MLLLLFISKKNYVPATLIRICTISKNDSRNKRSAASMATSPAFRGRRIRRTHGPDRVNSDHFEKMPSIFVEINPQSLFRFLFPFLLLDIAAAAPHAGANGAGPYLGRRIRALNRGQPVCHVHMFFLAVRSGARSAPPLSAARRALVSTIMPPPHPRPAEPVTKGRRLRQ